MRIREGEDKVNREQVYDWMLANGVSEPACVELGGRCFAGRWETISELHNRYACRMGKLAIVVLGEGSDWLQVLIKVKKRLADLESRAKCKCHNCRPGPSTPNNGEAIKCVHADRKLGDA